MVRVVRKREHVPTSLKNLSSRPLCGVRLFRQYVFSFGQREGRLAVCVRVLFCDVCMFSVSFLSSHLDTWNSVLSEMNWGE